MCKIYFCNVYCHLIFKHCNNLEVFQLISLHLLLVFNHFYHGFQYSIRMVITERVGEGWGTISSFICLSAGAIEWQPFFFATILLLYAPPKVISVLVLFVIFGGWFCSLLLHRASLATSVVYPVAFLHFSLLPLLQHAHSQRLGSSWLWAWAYSSMAFDIHLGLFRSPLLWIGTTCT